MNAESTSYQLSINLIVVIVLLALLLFGIGYSWIVHTLRRQRPDHGYTAVLVVIGNLAVAAGFSILVGINLTVLLILCMGAAGLPMIVEYTLFYVRKDDGKGGLDI